MTKVYKKGIKDHKKKLEILALLLGVKNTPIKVVEALLKNHSGENNVRVSFIDAERFADALRKYDRKPNGDGTNPTGNTGGTYLNCVESLLASVEIREDNLKSFFIHSSFDTFVLAIPMKSVNSNKELKDIIKPIQDKVDLDHITYSYPSNQIVDIEVMFSRKSIDQLIIYDSVTAANSWTSVLNNRSYKQYAECEEALEKTLASEEMESYFQEYEPDGFVKLGAGSTSKDKMILQSFQRKSNKCNVINFRLVDYSIAMLDISSKALHDILPNNSPISNKTVSFKNIKADFLDLPLRVHLRRTGVPVMFFITGGTIGNLDEGKFLSSILRVAEPNDLLIICCETLPDEVNEEYHKYLLSKYDHIDAKEMLSPALQKIWYLIDEKEHTFNEAIKLIKPKIVEDRWDGVTAVDNSVSIVFEYGCEPPIRLITSTRYKESSFVKFVEAYGFELLTVKSGKTNSKFKSFMFKVK